MSHLLLCFYYCWALRVQCGESADDIRVNKLLQKLEKTRKNYQPKGFQNIYTNPTGKLTAKQKSEKIHIV